MTKAPPFSEQVMEEGGLIFWDAIGLVRPQTGIFRHAHALYTELQGLGVNPRLLWPKGLSCAFPQADRLDVPALGLGAQIERLKLIWPRLAAIHLLKRHPRSRGIVHGLSNFNLSLGDDLGKNWRRVLTIHDLIPLLAPRDVSVALAYQMRRALKRLSSRVDRVVCVSEWTKSTLAEEFPELAARAVVIPNGLERPTVFPQRTPNARIQGLTVSRWESYKRLNDILPMLRELPALDVTVVTDANGKRWFESQAASWIAARRLTVKTKVGEGELKSLYAAAHVLIHPSLYEGFCLPIAEALASGLPVVYRSGHGADEVAAGPGGFPVGQGASTVDWCDAITAASGRVTDPAYREALMTSLLQRPTWACAAGKLASLYDTLLKSQS